MLVIMAGTYKMFFRIANRKDVRLLLKQSDLAEGVPMCMQKRTGVQLGTASIGFLDTQFNFWKKEFN